MKRTADGWIATSMRTLDAMRVYRPATVRDAVAELSRAVPPTVVAGGTDLVAQFNEGLVPHDLLALRDIEALRRIAVIDGRLHIGSCVTHDAGSRSNAVRDAVPGFASAWGRIANARVRLTATLGGNVMARRTRYELPILLEALGAAMHFEGALLTEVTIPLTGLIAFDYDRTLRPVMTQAVALRRAGDGGVTLRAAVGTEAVAPHALVAVLAGDPRRAAGDAYASLPDAFADAYTSNAYLRRAGCAILERQLKRLAREAA